jgi:hypothetical protein
MTRPYRAQKTGRSNVDHTLIRLSKDQYIHGLHARLGPEEYYRRRLARLAAKPPSAPLSCPNLTGIGCENGSTFVVRHQGRFSSASTVPTMARSGPWMASQST